MSFFFIDRSHFPSLIETVKAIVKDRFDEDCHTLNNVYDAFQLIGMEVEFDEHGNINGATVECPNEELFSILHSLQCYMKSGSEVMNVVNDRNRKFPVHFKAINS
jgi:hypothetical protein